MSTLIGPGLPLPLRELETQVSTKPNFIQERSKKVKRPFSSSANENNEGTSVDQSKVVYVPLCHHRVSLKLANTASIHSSPIEGRIYSEGLRGIGHGNVSKCKDASRTG